MMMLGINIGKNTSTIVLLKKNNSNHKLIDFKTVQSSNEIENTLKIFKSIKINKVCILLSDYYIYSFLDDFENIEESDIEKLIKFKHKDFVPFSINDINTGYQIINKKVIDGINHYKVVSALTDKNLVIQYENILTSFKIKDWTTTSSTYPLLNLCKGKNFILVNSDDEITTMIFLNNGEINYMRKFNNSSINGLTETINFYLRKYPKATIEHIYVTNEKYKEISGFNKLIKTIDMTKHITIKSDLKISKKELLNLTSVIGATLCT
ncbi:MAG: hypothetical protein ABH873_04415 [Candidatus Firestonebacteria bacterium]